MSVLCVPVRRLCVPNIMSLGVCLKKVNLVKVGTFARCSVKIHVFSLSGFKEEKLIKKQTYTKTETRKLYPRVFWTFLPNDVTIDPYNFELYRFKVMTFFETQCRSEYVAVVYRRSTRSGESFDGKWTVFNLEQYASLNAGRLYVGLPPAAISSKILENLIDSCKLCT